MVLVALGDQLLDGTFEEIKAQFPKLSFRKVREPMCSTCALMSVCSSQGGSHRRGMSLALLWPQVAVNLGKDGYMADIARETDDINVQIVFCNAGYMITGFFHNRCVGSCPSHDTAMPSLCSCAPSH